MSGFTPAEWHDFSAPDLEADELNRIEQGIVDAHDQLDSHTATLLQAIGRVHSARELVSSHLGDFANPHQDDPADVGLPTLDAAIAAHKANTANPHHTTAAQIGYRGSGPVVSGPVVTSPFGAVDVSTRGVSPANGRAANAHAVQNILDEMAQFGGGEVYFPFASGVVIEMDPVWVPANTRVYGVGCTIRKVRTGEEAGFFRARSGGGDLLGADAVFTIRQQTELSRPRPNNVSIEGLVIEGAEAYVNGISILGDNVLVKNVTIRRIPGLPGPPRCFADGIYIENAEHVEFDNVSVEYAGRNNVSVVGGRYLNFHDSHFNYCTAQKGDDLDYDVSPGCGVEFEPDAREQWSSDIVLFNCEFHHNAGAGIGFDLGPPHADSVLDDHGTRITIDHCSIHRNGQKPFMGNPGEAAGMTGNFFITGGESSGLGRIVLTDNFIRESARGHGIEALDGRTQLALVSNDLRTNENGAVSGQAKVVVDSGNLT